MGRYYKMVKAKVNIFVVAALVFASACSSVPKGYSWESFVMDAHRTGVTIPAADNIPEALGVVSEDGCYTAPNGRVFKGGCTPEVARLLIEVQPQMAALKEVVGYSQNGLVSQGPESPLSNFIADVLAKRIALLTGKKIDLAITNFGGIRCDINAGNVLLDNIASMLPFNNYGCYVSVRGKDLRLAFEYMASHKPQCVSSNVKVVTKAGKLLSVSIGGKPLDDNKFYNLATIDFLLDGGDGFKLARGAREMIMVPNKIGEIVLDEVRSLTAEGKSLDYFTDGRFVVQDAARKIEAEEKIVANPAKREGKPRLLIMHTNDTHSHMDPVYTPEGLRAGVIERAAFVDSIRAEYPASKLLLLHAGDFNQGSSYYSQMHGALETKMVNALAYDCLTLGNHELDDGIESLASRLAKVNSPVVCSNCEFPDTLQQFVKPYTILKRGGMKIGIIGLESNIAKAVSAPTANRINQIDNVTAVNKWAPFLKNNEGCDFVIMLSHAGYEVDQEIIPNVSGVDLVIGGHSHTFVEDLIYVTSADGKQVPIVTDGCWGINMGLVKVY